MRLLRPEKQRRGPRAMTACVLMMLICLSISVVPVGAWSRREWFRVDSGTGAGIRTLSSVAAGAAVEGVKCWMSEVDEFGEVRGAKRGRSKLNRVIQFASGAQELMYLAMEGKVRCASCPDKRCECALLVSERGRVLSSPKGNEKVKGAKMMNPTQEDMGRKKNMTKKEIWNEYFKLNRVKAMVNLLRTAKGGTKWEREWKG